MARCIALKLFMFFTSTLVPSCPCPSGRTRHVDVTAQAALLHWHNSVCHERRYHNSTLPPSLTATSTARWQEDTRCRERAPACCRRRCRGSGRCAAAPPRTPPPPRPACTSDAVSCADLHMLYAAQLSLASLHDLAHARIRYTELAMYTVVPFQQCMMHNTHSGRLHIGKHCTSQHASCDAAAMECLTSPVSNDLRIAVLLTNTAHRKSGSVTISSSGTPARLRSTRLCALPAKLAAPPCVLLPASSSRCALQRNTCACSRCSASC